MDLIRLSYDEILKFMAPEGKLIPQRCLKSVLMKHGFLDYLMTRYTDLSLQESDKEHLREILYRMINHIEIRPLCKVCGKPLVFSNNQYLTYCSRKCSNNDPETLQKIANSISKSQREVYRKRGDEVKEKRKQTLSEKYNIDIDSPTPFAVKEIQEKSKDTIKEKYGVENILTTDEVFQKRKQTIEEKSVKYQMETKGLDIEYLDNGNILVRNACPIHGDLEYTHGDFNRRFSKRRMNTSTPCLICNPIGRKYLGKQKKLHNIIREIYDGKIIENDRKTLPHCEIDIYLPDLKLGFEFNGTYWHMDKRKFKKDDVNKISNMTAEEIWERDRNKLELAKQNGIEIMVVKEIDFDNDLNNIILHIQNTIEKKKSGN